MFYGVENEKNASEASAMQKRVEKEIEQIKDNLECYEWHDQAVLNALSNATTNPCWETKCELNRHATRVINAINRDKAVQAHLPEYYVQSASQTGKGMMVATGMCT